MYRRRRRISLLRATHRGAGSWLCAGRIWDRPQPLRRSPFPVQRLSRPTAQGRERCRAEHRRGRCRDAIQTDRSCWAGAAVAMLHSGNHEEADKGLGVSVGGLDLLIIVDGAESGDGGVVPAVVEDKFPPRPEKGFRSGLVAFSAGGFLDRNFQAVIDVEGFVVPMRVLRTPCWRSSRCRRQT